MISKTDTTAVTVSIGLLTNLLIYLPYHSVNLTKIESYIHPKGFDVAQFYIDFEGHPDNDSVKLALEEMKFFCKEINILGVYKASDFRKK